LKKDLKKDYIHQQDPFLQNLIFGGIFFIFFVTPVDMTVVSI